jgi:hypothetical protein
LSKEIFEEDKLVENYPLKVTNVTIVESKDTFK